MPFRYNPFTHNLDIVDITTIPPGTVATLTGNSGGAVGPDGSNNINVVGTGEISVAGNPGTNTLTISTTAVGVPWSNSAGGALTNKNGYFATAAATYTLPAGAANGDTVEIVSIAGAGVAVTAQGGDIIRISNTTSSANGTATSSQVGDSLRLIFRLTGQTWYCVPSAAGVWTLA